MNKFFAVFLALNSFAISLVPQSIQAVALDLQVGANTDDCRKHWDGSNSTWNFSTSAVKMEVGYYSTPYQKMGGGMRFADATIPQGATITTAYLTFRCSFSLSGTTVKTRIRGEATDSATTFSDSADYNGRTRTSAVVDWDSIPAWTLDTDYNSPEIKTIIQEIVDRDGWKSGNALVIFWDDHEDRTDHNANCERCSYSYDGDPTYAPELHIEYIADPDPIPFFPHPAFILFVVLVCLVTVVYLKKRKVLSN